MASFGQSAPPAFSEYFVGFLYGNLHLTVVSQSAMVHSMDDVTFGTFLFQLLWNVTKPGLLLCKALHELSYHKTPFAFQTDNPYFLELYMYASVNTFFKLEAC